MGTGVTIPAVSEVRKLIRRAKDPLGYEEDELVSLAAEKQVDEEREGGNLFWDMLDKLQRPQRAIAGVMKDMIDGGGFSPLDRVGQALMGEEAFGIKDVIDEIAPGDWSRMTLPDWMGGKSVDPFKEVLGFMGDVVTDPLMYTRALSMAGKFMKPSPDVAAKFEKLVHAGKKGPKMMEEVGEKVAAKGTVNALVAEQAEHVYSLRKLDIMFKEAMEDPKAFAKTLPTEELRKEFYDEVYSKFVKPGFKASSATLGDQLREGERRLLSMKLPLVGKMLGFAEGQIPLIPKVADRFAAAGSDAIGKIFESVRLSPAGAEAAKMLTGVFRRGTGNAKTDYIITSAMGKARMKGEEYKVFLDKFNRTLKGHTDDATYDTINSYIRHPHDFWGYRYRTLSGEPRHIQVAVNTIRHLAEKMVKNEQIYPLLDTKTMSKALTAPEAHHQMMRVVKNELPKDLQKKFNTLRGVERAAKKVTGGKTGANKAAYDEALDNLLTLERAKGQKWLNSTLPYKETGYFPRVKTKDTDEWFQTFMGSNTLQYGGVPALKFVQDALYTRKGWWKEVDADIINKAWQDGDLPVDFWDTISKQARGLKGKEKTAWDKWLGALDNDQRHFYVDDPAQAFTFRAVESMRSMTNAESIEQSIKMVAQKVDVEHIMNPTSYIGNQLYIPSPKGLEVLIGKAWKSELPPGAADWYKSALKEGRLKTGVELQGVFTELSNTQTYALAASKGIPVYAVPIQMAKDLNRVIDASRNAGEWSKYLKIYDEVTNFWKASTLAIFPAYHARNVIGQFWNGYLGGVTAKNYIHATKLMQASGKWKTGWPFGRVSLAKPTEAMKDLGVDVAGGSHMDALKLMDGANNNMVFETTIAQEFIGEAEKGLRSTARRSKAMKAALQFTHKGVPIKALFQGGSAIESVHRLALYINRIEKGYTPFKASREVVKYFFDYAQMSKFDKVMTRGFPFWRWTRNNVPLQLEMLVRQPHKAANLGRFIRWFQSDEGKEFDRKLLPKWANEQYGVTMRVNRKTGDAEVFLLRSWVPAMDMMSVISTNPFHSVTRTLGALAHPFPKGIGEAYMNRSLYTERDIEEFPKEPVPGGFIGLNMRKKTAHAIKSMPYGRLANEIDKMIHQYGPAGTMGLSQRLSSAAGISPKIKSFNVEGLIKRKKFDVNMRKAMIRRKLNKAKKLKNPEFVRYFKDLLEDAGQ